MGILAFAGAVVVPRIAAEKEADRRWALALARGGLRVGIDPSYQPFSYFTAEGWQGYDADLARELTRRMGLTLWAEPVGYDGFYDALRTEQMDVSLSALVPDASQTRDIGYTQPYFVSGLMLVGACTEATAVPDCLAWQRLAVALGSPADQIARRWERRVPGLIRVAVMDDSEALGGMPASADAALVDELDAWKPIQRIRGEGKLPLQRIESRSFVIATRADDARLRSELDGHIERMRSDGTLERLAAKWLGAGR